RLWSRCAFLEAAFLPVAQSLLRGIVPGSPGHSAAGMRARSAQVESIDRSAILRPARYRPHEEQLLQRQIAVKNISLREAIGPLQIQRCQHLAGDDGSGNVGGILANLANNAISQDFPVFIPRPLA